MTILEHDKGEILTHAAFDVTDAAVTLRAGDGAAMTSERRDALLEAIRAGKHVEVTLEIMPFRQRTGEINRNAVRFRDGALRAMGRSGKGMPFLRDHDQGSSDAIGGYITASRCELEGEGDAAEWRLYQTVTLTAPWAVEMALRGLLRRFSIGWNATGPVLCTICRANYFSRDCAHWRGQRLEDGRVVELEYQDAELVETSSVPVPAVKGTSVESVRAAALAARQHSGAVPRGEPMSLISKIAPILLLSATASEDEAAQAVAQLASRNELLEQKSQMLQSERDGARKELDQVRAELEQLQATDLQRREDDFIAAAVQMGKLKPQGDAFEDTLRTWFRRDPKAAAELRDSRANVTPAGQLRQSGKPAPTNAGTLTAGAQELVDHGFNPDIVERQLRQLGVKDPAAVIERRFAAKED